MRVTVVIPALNEAGNIGRLVEEIYASVPASRLSEVIVVDDASTDATGAEIKALIEGGNCPGLRYLRHDRRSGQSAAMRSGILAATSPIIATMDGDGQNDPHDIPRLLEVLAAPGSDGPALVGGVRTERKATGSKRWASRAANWIRDKVLQDECPDTGCGIKVYWREVFLRLPFFTSMHRYLPALFQTYGHMVAYLPVNDRPRQAGVSKYNNLNRALVGLYDLVGVTWLRKRTKVPAIVERHPETAQVRDLGARLKPVNDAGARLSAGDKSWRAGLGPHASFADRTAGTTTHMTFFGHAAPQLSQWWNSTSATEMTWLTIGFLAQLMFSMRFIVQWIASERARRSIVPETFWYFSLVGGAMLFAYAIYRLDPVFMLGQGMGLLIYARNIYFIRTHHRAAALAAAEGGSGLRSEQPANRTG